MSEAKSGGALVLDGGVHLFNHANYGSYVVNESSPQYGQPSFNANVAYQPRMAFSFSSSSVLTPPAN